MAPFDIPLTLRSADRDVHLIVGLPGPMSFAAIEPGLLAAVGLPVGTPLYLGVGPVQPQWILGAMPLLAGIVLTTAPRAAPAAGGPVTVSCVAGPGSGRSVAINTDPVVIGRGAESGLCLADPAVSRRHARIQAIGGRVHITDLGSLNGIELNGRPIQGRDVEIDANSSIRVGGSVLRLQFDADHRLLCSPDGTGHLAVARPPRIAAEFAIDLAPDAPPRPERTRRPIPLLAALIGTASGVLIAALTGLWTFLLLAALGPLMMVGTAVADRLTGRRTHRRAMIDHRISSAVDAQDVADAVDADRVDAWDRYPDPVTLLRRAMDTSARLWERRRGDSDFLRLSVGVGTRPARLPRTHPPPVDEVPLVVGLRECGVLGLTGDSRSVLRNLIAQLVTLHSPAELRLVVCSTEPDLDCLLDLPHLAGGTTRWGQVLRHDDAAALVLAELAAGRAADRAGDRISVLILDGSHRWRKLPGVKGLLAAAAARQSALVAICVAPSAAGLPLECVAIAHVSGHSVSFESPMASFVAEFTGVDVGYLADVAGALAGLTDPDSPARSVPDRLRLADLDGTPDVAAVSRGWANPSVSALLGATRAGALRLDLEREGPHLLIAGTTGSGKSELLQTMVAGLALAAGPDRLALLLIDFKGGATFGELRRLAHTTGVVSDLDGPLAERALASLRAEVRRRERLLAGLGVADLAAYRRSLRAGRLPPEPSPPSLVIVVDEFATLAAELPTFLTGLVDIAQRGRSLGLHLIMATQRPSGSISPAIRANIAARICLRVADDHDSMDVIDVPDASRIPVELPGRAMLRTARGSVLEFQTAQVTGSPLDVPVFNLRDGPAVRSLPDQSAISDLGRLVGVINAAAADLPRPDAPWLPPLPDIVTDRPPGDLDLALADEPDAQRRRWVSAPAGSILIAGPPGAGRSTTLRRIARCAARAASDLVLVDCGGLLSDVAGWRATTTSLDSSDPALIQRLIFRLHCEMVDRAGRSGRPILLVLDGLDQISAALDGLDFGVTMALLTELAGRGPSCWIRVAAAGDSRMTMHRAAPSFGTLVTLAVDGRGTQLPRPAPGRGAIDGRLVQIIQAPAGEPEPDWAVRSGGAALTVRPLPPSVLLDEVLPGSDCTCVVIGRGGDDGGPLTVDLTGPAFGLLVAGPRRSGVSTALTTLALSAQSTGFKVLRATLRSVAALPGIRDVDVRFGPAELEKELVEHVGRLLLLMDEVDTVADQPVAELLMRYLSIAEPGQHLAIGARLDRAVRSHRGIIAETAAHRTGILLQADVGDGTLLGVVLPRRRASPHPGRGHLVRGGEVTAIQVAG